VDEEAREAEEEADDEDASVDDRPADSEATGEAIERSPEATDEDVDATTVTRPQWVPENDTDANATSTLANATSNHDRTTPTGTVPLVDPRLIATAERSTHRRTGSNLAPSAAERSVEA
jgi:hypothetical protein